MKTMLKRMFIFMLALMLVVSAFPLMGLRVQAASGWPSLSSSAYCEYLCFRNVDVFATTTLTDEDRGTCDPFKRYNAYAEPGDIIKIIEVCDNWAKIIYPTPSGYKTGYCKTSALLGRTSPAECITAQAKVTTYKSDSTGDKSGHCDRNDTVYKLGTSKSGFVFIMYTAKSGSRAWKTAFVTKDGYQKLQEGTGDGYSESEVRARLDEIASGDRVYDKNTVMTLWKKFSGTNAGYQCKGFAKNVWKMTFGVDVPSTQDKDKGLNYLLYDSSEMDKLGTVKGIAKDSADSEQALRELFAKSRPGDFVQIRRHHTGSHSAIVYSVDDTNNDGIYDQVTFFEANTDGKNTVKIISHDWRDLCDNNSAMTVYTAADYRLMD